MPRSANRVARTEPARLGNVAHRAYFFLRRDVSEPPVELGRAVARIRAGNERLIVQFDTEIERFRIHNYRPRLAVLWVTHEQVSK